MATPGADIRDVFDRVREDVLKATSYKQVPWTAVSLSGPYEFKPAGR
jgi:uncharacterized caspase-like protein